MSDKQALSFNVFRFDFSREGLAEMRKLIWVTDQWPVIYLLYDNQEQIAYVGESTDMITRMEHHLDNEQRARFRRVAVIGSNRFHKSATLDIEAFLIQHITATEDYVLQNGNNGLVNHTYYQHLEYRKQFSLIWKKLFQRSLINIELGYYFKYSPYKSLNNDQYKAVLRIIEGLNDKHAGQIFIQGFAGTGKTILAIYLIKLLISDINELNTEDVNQDRQEEVDLMAEFRQGRYRKPEIALVVAMQSLRNTLKKVFSNIKGLNASMVIGPSDTFEKKYDILIVDEAHRLRQNKNIPFRGAFGKYNRALGLGLEGTELEWLEHNSERQIFFYDALQSIRLSDIPAAKFNERLNKRSAIKLQLNAQMRLKAGSHYVGFVDHLLHGQLDQMQKRAEPLRYDLQVFDSFGDMYRELARKERKYKLCRLIAGFSWPWETNRKGSRAKYDIEIEGLKFKWNQTRKDIDWINSRTAFKEIGCIHTTQGYDLNYAGVIFGEEIVYNPDKKRIEIIRDNYYDRYGKADTSDKQLEEFILNIYRTLMLRGVEGTYIYACDRNLREYLKDKVIKYTKMPGLTLMHERRIRAYVNCVPVCEDRTPIGSVQTPPPAISRFWAKLPKKYKPSANHFVVRMQGESMNQKIPNGAWCLFETVRRKPVNGEIVMVEHRDIQDVDFIAGRTIRIYQSESIEKKGRIERTITLEPLSDQYQCEDIVLKSNLDELDIVGIFIGILSNKV